MVDIVKFENDISKAKDNIIKNYLWINHLSKKTNVSLFYVEKAREAKIEIDQFFKEIFKEDE